MQETADRLETVAHLCAVLASALRAGLTPARALEVAECTETDERLRSIGGGILGACWDVAIESGASPGQLLDRLSVVLAEQATSMRQAEVAAAGPRATFRLVLWLPLGSVIIAQLAGIPALTVLVSTGGGLVLLALGLSLLVVAQRWLNLLVSRAQRFSWACGLAPDLLAMVLRSSGAPSKAWGLVDIIPSEGYRDLAAREHEKQVCHDTLARSDEWGVPAAALLELHAALLRRHAQQIRDVAHAKLTVKVLIPLGVCVLPAFVLLAVVPSVLALLSSTGLGAG